MNILELSEKRFSARKYTAEPVAQSDLDYIMECVRLAPSAVNKQPWKFVIVRSEEAKQKLWRAYDREWFRTAQLYIVCMKNNNACWTRSYDDKKHGDVDVAIATVPVSCRYGAWSGHLLGVQLRHRRHKRAVPVGRLRDCGNHPHRSCGCRLPACREEAQADGRDCGGDLTE